MFYFVEFASLNSLSPPSFMANGLFFKYSVSIFIKWKGTHLKKQPYKSKPVKNNLLHYSKLLLNKYPIKGTNLLHKGGNATYKMMKAIK